MSPSRASTTISTATPRACCSRCRSRCGKPLLQLMESPPGVARGRRATLAQPRAVVGVERAEEFAVVMVFLAVGVRRCAAGSDGRDDGRLAFGRGIPGDGCRAA